MRLLQSELNQGLIGIAITIAAAFLIALFFGFVYDWNAYGDDTEEGCILPVFCEYMQKQTIDDRIQILQIWNAAGCSVRDICTPIQCDITNQSCPNVIAPQIQNFSGAKH